MMDPFLLALPYNVALLLSMVYLLELATSRWRSDRFRLSQVTVGIGLGAIGIVLMITSWAYQPGINFDTRSVLLGIAGLFFGLVPTVIAMAMTAAMRLYQGGIAAWTGVFVIVATGCIGLIWRHMYRTRLAELSAGKLYLFGLVVHAAMLLLMWTLPWGTARPVLSNITLPVLVVYPLVTVALGMLMVDRLRRGWANEALRQSEMRYRLLFETSLDGILLTVPDGTILAANPAACRMFGYTETELQQLGRSGVVDTTDPRLQEALAQRQRTGKFHGELTFVRKDGAKFPAEISSAVSRRANGTAWTSMVVRDVTARKQAEAAIRKSEAALQQAQSVAHVGSWTWHIAENRVEWSDEMYRIFGLDKERLTGSLADVVAQTIHPEDRAAVERASRAILENGNPQPIEYRIVRTDGQERVVWREVGELVLDHTGKPTILTGIVQDITDRKRIENTLHESEARYRQLLDVAPVGVVVHAEGEILFVNQTGANLFGAGSVEELAGKQIMERVYPSAAGKMQARLHRLTAGRPDSYPVQDTYRKLDGTPFKVEIIETHLTYNGKSAVQTIMVDISRQLVAEAQLHLQSTALEAAANAIMITDATGDIEWVNPAFTTLTGYTLAESRGHNPRDLVRSGLQEPDYYQEMWSTILSGQVWRGEILNRRKDGSLYTEEMTVTPVLDENGGIAHFIAVKSDISARKQHEREAATVAALSLALRKATTRREMVSAVLDQLSDLFEIDRAMLGTVTGATGDLFIEMGRGAWANCTGQHNPPTQPFIAEPLSRRELYINNNINNNVADSPKLNHGQEWANCQAVASVPLIVGERITGLISVGSMQQLTEHDGRLLASIADIVASALFRETLHEKVLAQAAQMTKIMESVPQGLLLVEREGDILLANSQADRLLERLASNMSNMEERQLTQLGDLPLAELLSASPDEMPHEVHVGDALFEVTAQPVPNGAITEQWVLFAHDATQERQVQARMQQQERLATVGQMAAGIAHDFNNILAVMMLYAEVTAKAKGLSDPDRTRLKVIQEQGTRASELIRQILDFSRQSVMERQPLDILPLVKEHVKLLEWTLPGSISVGLAAGDQDYIVSADPTRIQQVVMNLAINARDAMPDGGELRIEIERVSVAAGELPLLPEIEAGDWVRLSVSDTGIGIAEESRRHIFDPFFTTKAPGQGTGLGLAQVHGIVLQHDGHIQVASMPGEGATFTIYFPALVKDARQEAASPPADVDQGNGELVLVVEDNSSLRVALVEMLAAQNYAALEASDGREAFFLLQKHSRRDDIALVLSDSIMPNMSGFDLVHAMRREGWDMPVILMSGHPTETEMEDLKRYDVHSYLNKPFGPKHLAAAVTSALQGIARQDRTPPYRYARQLS